MKIVDRKSFLELPAGTVFARYRHALQFDELMIKGETQAAFFWAQPLVEAIDAGDTSDMCEQMELAMNEQRSVAMNFDYEYKDTLVDDRLFAVWEDADVAALIARLQRTLGAKT